MTQWIGRSRPLSARLRALRRGALPSTPRRAALAALLPSAAASASAADMPGGKDHPLVERFAGSTIVAFNVRRFDSSVRQTVPFERYETRASPIVGGTATRIGYESPGIATATELLRNDRNERTAPGFTGLDDSTKDGSIRARPGYVSRFGSDTQKSVRTNDVFLAANGDTTRFTTFRLARPAGDAYVGVTTLERTGPDASDKTVRGASAAVDGIEVAALKRQTIVVPANEIAKSMTDTGRVAQSGIAASRLAPFGVADLAPVASNANEAGRAKNRRVELVPQ